MSLLRALRSGLAARPAQPWAAAALSRASWYSTEAAPAQEKKQFDPSTLTPRERLLQEYNARLYSLTLPEK